MQFASSDVVGPRPCVDAVALGDMTNNIPPPAVPDFLPGNTIVSVALVFDEGTDTGPDFTGDVILDNIEVNGVIVGRPPCVPSQPCN